ncbi:transporter substrate-binding domain-containing protein [Catellatospora tritici]|uniref:transporter substrate-binding domain-containing protein n=1 Tax=Catellatospora tritici TaxID=2851566 RepID=UPI001C2D011C|nr:transporter substrate-binding domain-containing protein [Catellatospora tritici]MBV1852826.1 transporter substrate-binding domain-containing protein [Catellatospora tritici]
MFRHESPPSVQEYLKQSHIYGQPKLRIGVTRDLPLLGIQDSKGEFSGFDVEVGRLIAEELGYSRPGEVEFVGINVLERITKIEDGSVDMVLASLTDTEDRRKHIKFAGPYIVTDQKVMVPKSSENSVRSITDLRGKRVCVPGPYTTSFTNLQALNLGLDIRPMASARDCYNGLLQKPPAFDAMSTGETILAGFLYATPGKFSIVPSITIGPGEPVGVGIPIDDPHLQALVGYILKKQYDKRKNSRWQIAYDTTLAKILGPKSQPPPQNVIELTDHADADTR